MMPQWMFRTFLLLSVVAAAQLMPQEAAAESPSGLTCKVRPQPGGLFMYQLSRPPSSPSCRTDWEDQNKICMARDSSYNQTLVQNLTNQSIVLKHCWDYLHFSEDCSGRFDEAHCRVNCSCLLDTDIQPPTVNSTLICITESLCLKPLTVWISIAVLVLALSAFGGLFLWRSFKRRRGETVAQTTTYNPVNEQIRFEMEKGEIS